MITRKFQNMYGIGQNLKPTMCCIGQSMHAFNPFVPELNSWGNPQNPGFKLQNFMFSFIFLPIPPSQPPPPTPLTKKTGIYKNGHSWTVHMLCH